MNETNRRVAANENDATPAPIRAVLEAVEDMRQALTDPKQRAKGVRALGRFEFFIREHMGKLPPASQAELAYAWKATARRRPSRVKAPQRLIPIVIVDEDKRTPRAATSPRDGVTAETREAIAVANRQFAKARGPKTLHVARLAVRRAERLLERDLGSKLRPIAEPAGPGRLHERVVRLVEGGRDNFPFARGR